MSVFVRFNIYYAWFIFCEFLNFVVVCLQFIVTDKFLNHGFLTYGLKVPTLMTLMNHLNPPVLLSRCGSTTSFLQRSSS